MLKAILTDEPQFVNQQNYQGKTHQFLQVVSDGTILAGESIADILAHQASHSHKIKLHAGESRCTARFFNGKITQVELEPGDYDALVVHLKEAGWKLEPGAYVGAYVARLV